MSEKRRWELESVAKGPFIDGERAFGQTREVVKVAEREGEAGVSLYPGRLNVLTPVGQAAPPGEQPGLPTIRE